MFAPSLFASLLAFGNFATACPRCEAGVEARRRFLEQSPFEAWWAAILPFVMIGAVSLLVEHIGRDRS